MRKRLTEADFAVGLLSNTEHPGLQAIPSISIQNPTKSGTNWLVPITFKGLIAFGTSTLPISFQGKKIDTIHILKTGLEFETAPVSLQENTPFLLVLRNTSGFNYSFVRARLRFRDQDVCAFSVERLRSLDDAAPPKPGVEGCDQVDTWARFEVPQYTAVSLHALPIHQWFLDSGTGLARKGKVKGTLTLRYFTKSVSGQSQPIEEQTLPIEVDSTPGTWSQTQNYITVGLLLLVGAFLSILIRVAIPNYRRFRLLKEQLIEIRKIIRGVSDAVDSMLRVQLRVERLSLDMLRKSVWVVSPGFSGVAQRVESGTATLLRRVDYVRRLDAALNRKRLLIEEELAPPTRITAIDKWLNAASSELESDQFREEDWVLIQQSLEAADKSLSDPSEDEKSAFETLLSQRWKSISGHYGFVPGNEWALTPEALNGMDICFPEYTALPSKDDSEGVQWIKEIGVVRADLQISALELIREFEFLAPTRITDHWIEARGKLIPWLATPALENLGYARLLLRQLAEEVDAQQIITALQNGEAQIELDPQSVGSGERVHMAIRFRRTILNSAAARQQFVCEWRIRAVDESRQSGTPENKPIQTKPNSDEQNLVQEDVSRDQPYYREKGWEIYHYFESFDRSCPLTVSFYFDGRPILKAPDQKEPLMYSYVIDLQSENASRRRSAKADLIRRASFEALELLAILLVPLCALTLSTADTGATGNWWQLIGLGFGSDTIRNVLSGSSEKAQA